MDFWYFCTYTRSIVIKKKWIFFPLKVTKLCKYWMVYINFKYLGTTHSQWKCFKMVYGVSGSKLHGQWNTLLIQDIQISGIKLWSLLLLFSLRLLYLAIMIVIIFSAPLSHYSKRLVYFVVVLLIITLWKCKFSGHATAAETKK